MIISGRFVEPLCGVTNHRFSGDSSRREVSQENEGFTSQVDFTESGTEGANLEFPSGILWQSSVTSTCDLVGGPVGSSTLQPPAAEGFTPLCSINPTDPYNKPPI